MTPPVRGRPVRKTGDGGGLTPSARLELQNPDALGGDCPAAPRGTATAVPRRAPREAASRNPDAGGSGGRGEMWPEPAPHGRSIPRTTLAAAGTSRYGEV